MKIIDTQNYFKNKLEEEIKTKKITNEGLISDYMGKGFEYIFANLFEKENKSKIEIQLINDFNSFFNKKIKTITVLDNSYKGDILITFEDKSSTCVSLKHTKCTQVTSAETSCNIINNYFNDKNFYKSIKKFEEHKFRSTFLKKENLKDYKYIEDFLSKNTIKFLEFVIKGRKKEFKPDYIVFLDKVNSELFISSIDDYINFIIAYGRKGTFGSHTNITRASGTGVMQTKIQNPLKLKNRNTLISKFLESKEV